MYQIESIYKTTNTSYGCTKCSNLLNCIIIRQSEIKPVFLISSQTFIFASSLLKKYIRLKPLHILSQLNTTHVKANRFKDFYFVRHLLKKMNDNVQVELNKKIKRLR
jgi:hypothetical protein